MKGREADGRFAKGNQVANGHSNGKTGRPPKKREERFMEITLSTVTFARWKKVIEKALTQAERGDSAARKFLADYLVGPPGQRVDITSGGARFDSTPDIGALAEVLATLGVEPPD